MTTMSKRTALITGASAGIGERFSHRLAREGYNLILVARRRERLEALAESLAGKYGVDVRVLSEDLGDPQAPSRIIDQVQTWDLHVDFLVNNAGFAAKTSLVKSEWPELQQEIQVMVTALTELMIRFGKQMVSRGYGHIVNVSSLAAFAPTPAGMLYTGIKSYVLNASESADMEFKRSGVHVTALCPGFTYTEFHDVQGTRDLVSKLPSVFWQDAETVVDAGYRAVLAGRPVCVPGAFNKTMGGLSRILPEALRYRLGSRGRIY
ncbi:SDR family oxidoreductase [Marinobacter nanhaiticus D15-8W]|uniref:SDR family oxidoreductase n=2 Tax=Marinobacter TaxID=2742 RepID=N6WSX9_9GAMM|nr:SDR family oxidoreductase [Marinobacter nanhaiticus D15-8W]